MADKPKKTAPSKAEEVKADEPLEEFDPNKSNLVQHAIRELDLAGIGEEDSDYGGAIAKCVLDLVTLFASQRHSGASAELTKQIFVQVVSFDVLTPLTSDPAEWQSVSEMFNEPMWQNKRSPAYFSKDGGKTWMHAESKKKGKSITPKELENAKKKTPTPKPKADK